MKNLGTIERVLRVVLGGALANKAGTGGLVIFADSNWLMSVVLPYQPHFINQPEGVNVF